MVLRPRHFSATASILAGISLFLLANPRSTLGQAQDGDTDSQLIIFAGQSRVITAPWPTQRMAVTNPEIADVEAITPTQVMLLGKKVGSTDLIMWSAKDEMWKRRIDVQVDLKRLEDELARLFPKSDLKIAQSQDVVVLTGTLTDTPQRDRLRKFLRAAETSTGLKYADLTSVLDGPANVAAKKDAAYISADQLKDELTHLFPDSELEVRQSRDVIIVSGLLRRVDESVQLRKYLEAMEKASEKFSERALRYRDALASAPANDEPDERDEELRYSGFKFVDMTSVAGVQQVQLQVRVAEVSRVAIRSLSMNEIYGPDRDATFFGVSQVGPSTGGTLNPTGIEISGNPHLGNGMGVAFDTTISPLNTLVLGFPRADLRFFLQALAENQYLRVLAEPTLVALSGEEASFLAGGEFPIPIIQGSIGGTTGGTSVTIEYKEFGVRLRFRPTVLGDATIRLHVAPEVSDLSDIGAIEIQGFRVPSLTTRRAETTMELKSGQTFSMAGLLNEQQKGTSSRIPGLGDVPVLGALFRSVRYERGETELVVLVTASLVEPLSISSPPPLPGVLDCEPNDWELYLEGRVEGRETPCLSDYDAEWLRKLGFDELEGPGGWETYDQAPSRSENSPVRTAAHPTSEEKD